jgi:benzodiazapine receptor
MDDLLTRERWGPVAAALAAVLAANLVVAALGLEGDGADPDLPGWLIGSVWVALFACLGGAYAALERAPAAAGSERAALVGLGLLCLAYPFYTAGFELRAVSLAGTAITFVYGLALALRVQRVSGFAAALLVPLLLWLVVAAFLLI